MSWPNFVSKLFYQKGLTRIVLTLFLWVYAVFGCVSIVAEKRIAL